MNDNIVRILEKYQNKSSDDILNDPQLTHDIATLQKQMVKASADEQSAISLFLTPLLKDIENKITAIKEQLSVQSERIDLAQKSSEACLAYIKAKTEKG